MIISVSDVHDPRLDPFRWRDRQLASKLDRQETVGAGLFVAEGDLVVTRALDANCLPVALLCDEHMAQHFERLVDEVDIYVGDEQLRRDVTGLGVPLKATGLFRRPPLTHPEELVSSCSRIVVAEAIDNPTNLGAIIRSATALGWDGLILTEGSADPLARRALRVSMGTGLSLPFSRCDTADQLLEVLRRHMWTTVALTPHPQAQSITDFTMPSDSKIALFFGSEREGLTETSMSSAMHHVRIPMHRGTDSLNVAAAAAISLFALGPQ